MQRLTIYYTSDTHGYFLPTDFRDNEQKDMGLCKAAKMITKDGNTLVIDGGDSLQGSPMVTYLAQQGDMKPVAKVFNAMGTDYVTLGNHDFNHGKSMLSDYLSALDGQCVCANVHDAQGLLPNVPYRVHVLENGLKIGIIGAVTDYVPVWERKENLSGITFSSAVEAMKTYAVLLRPMVDIVVGIYHGGFERDLESGKLLAETNENVACAICDEADIDILLTGHQHRQIADQCYHGVHIVQTPCNATGIIKLEVVKEQNGLRITSEAVKVCGEADAHLMAALAPLNEKVQAWLDSPAGHFPYDLMPADHLTMASGGNAIADFFNQVQLFATGAQLSCTSLANEVKGFNKNATIRDVVSTYVYANTLITLDVTGDVLKKALERSAAYFDKAADGSLVISERFLQPKVEHYNYDYFAGLHYAFDISKPVGERVCEMVYQGKPIDKAAHFTLCMTDYRASGTGGYDMFKTCPRVCEDSKDVCEWILDYLKAHRQFDIVKSDYWVF